MHCYPFANGQGRLIDRSFMGRLRFAEKTLVVKCAGGYPMRVMPNDHIGRHMYLTGRFDPSIVSVLRSFCTRGDERILDIGANVGSVSCALLHVLPGCRVVSVEPQAAVYALLAENLKAVGGDRAAALNVAISDRDGEGKMAVDPANSGSTHVISATGAAGGGPVIDVQMVSGERLFELSGLDRIDVIKIDVEGFEETVLRALATTIQSRRPRAVLFEHHGDLSPPDAPIRRQLESCGYRLLGIRKSLLKQKLVPIEALSGGAHDYVAVPLG